MQRALTLLALGTSVVALVSSFVLRPSEPPPVERAPVAQVDDGELRRRVDQLEDDNRALWDRVSALERRQGGVLVAATDGGAPSVPMTEVTKLRDELRSVMTGEVLSSEAGRAALKDVIREVSEDQQRERTAARQQRVQQRAAEQREKWKGFASAAKLTWAQEQKLTERLDLEDQLRAALMAQQLEGQGSRDDFRKLRDTQRETDQAMGALLDDTQKAQFEELRRDERGGAGRQRNGGGGETAR